MPEKEAIYAVHTVVYVGFQDEIVKTIRDMCEVLRKQDWLRVLKRRFSVVGKYGSNDQEWYCARY